MKKAILLGLTTVTEIAICHSLLPFGKIFISTLSKEGHLNGTTHNTLTFKILRGREYVTMLLHFYDIIHQYKSKISEIVKAFSVLEMV